MVRIKYRARKGVTTITKVSRIMVEAIIRSPEIPLG
nr:MAG TPA: hypothetical protein [Caudoviricetes sp.]